MKHKINISIISVVALMFMSMSGCKKDKCNAGTGGNTTIAAFPQHHGMPISGQSNYLDTAYIKFCTKEFPGDDASKYDMVIAGEDSENHVHIPNLKTGDYYIYMTGYDTVINQRVKGGMPYTIEQESGEVDVTVAVSE